MDMLNWLFANARGMKTAYHWAQLLSIEIIDDDGWRGSIKTLNTPITLTEFLDRVSSSTIRPIS